MSKISLTNKTQTKDDKFRQQQLREAGQLPEHIAVIMDGNGRWARERGTIRIHGHKAGVDSVRDITESCAQLGVKYLTLYAFSTENWNRPPQEVGALMKLLIQSLRKETSKLNENDIRLTAIGDIDRLPDQCRTELVEGMQLTADNTRMELCLALSYSGRWDITQAVKKLSRQIALGTLRPDDITDDLIAENLTTADIPDPDLIIRTGGEYRLSNFLLWQLAYSELYVSDKFWPDFRRDDLYAAITSYQTRERRFGKISEQIHTEKKNKLSVSI